MRAFEVLLVEAADRGPVVLLVRGGVLKQTMPKALRISAAAQMRMCDTLQIGHGMYLEALRTDRTPPPEPVSEA